LKAVMEKALVARGILEQIVPDDMAATNIRRSITYTDWLKMEYNVVDGRSEAITALSHT